MTVGLRSLTGACARPAPAHHPMSRSNSSTNRRLMCVYRANESEAGRKTRLIRVQSEAQSQSNLRLPPRAKVVSRVAHTARPGDRVHAVRVLARSARRRVDDQQVVERRVIDLPFAAVEQVDQVDDVEGELRLEPSDASIDSGVEVEAVGPRHSAAVARDDGARDDVGAIAGFEKGRQLLIGAGGEGYIAIARVEEQVVG